MAKEAIRYYRVSDLALKIGVGQVTRTTDVILFGLMSCYVFICKHSIGVCFPQNSVVTVSVSRNFS